MILVCSINWDAFTALGTILMAIASFITIFKLYEAKRAKLFTTISIHAAVSSKGNPKRYWCLEITNIGQSPAYDIELRMDSNFINSLPIKSERKILTDLMSRKFVINPNCSKIYPLSPVSVAENELIKGVYDKPGEYKKAVDAWLKENMDKPFLVELLYKGNCWWYRKTLTLRQYDTRGAVFNEDEKTIKVEIINGKTEVAES